VLQQLLLPGDTTKVVLSQTPTWRQQQVGHGDGGGHCRPARVSSARASTLAAQTYLAGARSELGVPERLLHSDAWASSLLLHRRSLRLVSGTTAVAPPLPPTLPRVWHRRRRSIPAVLRQPCAPNDCVPYRCFARSGHRRLTTTDPRLAGSKCGASVPVGAPSPSQPSPPLRAGNIRVPPLPLEQAT
jgi:hypothetical protein